MNRRFFILALFGLAACAGSNDSAPVSLSESDRAVLARLESARSRLLAAVSELRAHPERGRYLCNAQLAGKDPYLAQNLKSVVENPDKLDYLRKSYFTPEQLEAVADALARLKFHASEDPKDLELNEAGMDAFANGYDVTVGSVAFRSKTDDQILGVVGHEVRHALGELDVGRAGPFGDRASAIDGASACLFSLVAGVESRSDVVQWEPVLVDDFTRAGSLSGYRPLDGEWTSDAAVDGFYVFQHRLIQASGSYGGVPTQVVVKDRSFAAVRLGARLWAGYGTASLVARRSDSGNYYAATFANRYWPEFQIERVQDGQRTVLASLPVEFQPSFPESYRFEFTLDGPKLRLIVNDTYRLEAEDTTFAAGSAGIGANLGKADDFKLERQTGTP